MASGNFSDLSVGLLIPASAIRPLAPDSSRRDSEQQGQRERKDRRESDDNELGPVDDGKPHQLDDLA